MPLVNVKLIEGVFTPTQKQEMIRKLTDCLAAILDEADRVRFLGEARRVAAELVVVDSALRPDVEPEELQERILDDGSRWEVYKRYFTPTGLADELGGGRTLLAGRWFVAVRS